MTWKLPGAAHKGPVIWADSLAFSPDSTRLAFFLSGSGGPSSEKTNPTPGGPPVNPLRILTLEAGKDAPTVKGYKDLRLQNGMVTWRPGSIMIRSHRDIELIDPATGASKTTFLLPFFPSGVQPSGKNQRPLNEFDRMLPANWYKVHLVLSADGSRLAALVYHSEPKAKSMQTRIIVWDVAGRKELGRIPFDTELSPGASAYGSPQTLRIAISGNGSRLAMSDGLGAIHVYDLSRLNGTSKVKPAGPVDDKAVLDDYEKAASAARERLLRQFDDHIQKLEKAPGKGTVVALLKDEKVRFDKHGSPSWMEVMRGDTGSYLLDLGKARSQVLDAYGSAGPPANVRERLDKQVIARWRHQPGDGVITLYSSGGVNEPRSVHNWHFGNGVLILRWKDPKAPGGYWVDTCALAADGQSYAGMNQNKTKVFGKLLREE